MPKPHLTTNDKLQAALDGATRSNIDANVGESSTGSAQQTYQRGKRLARLYGSNHGSKIVARRLRSRAQAHLRDGSMQSLTGGSSASVADRVGATGGLLSGGPLDSMASMASLDGGGPQTSSPIKQPVDVELRQSSPYRTVVEPPHPWYCGYRNNSKAIPSSVFPSASRYGFAGSVAMSQRSRPLTSMPSLSKPPQFLAPPQLRDEWAPKQQGSPMLWIEDSAYVTGSKLHHTNTHVVYGPRHEACLTDGSKWEGEGGLAEQESVRYKNLGRAYNHAAAEHARLQGCLERERKRGGKMPGMELGAGSVSLMSSVGFGTGGGLLAGGSVSVGGASRDATRRSSRGRARERERATRGAGASMMSRKGSEMLKYLPGNSHMMSVDAPPVQQDRKLKYWNSLTMVCSDEHNPDAAAEKLEKEKHDRLMRYQMKWKELAVLHKVLRSYRKPNLEDLEDLQDTLLKTACENPVPTQLSREQFSRIMFNHHGAHALVTTKHVNRLFSCFDPFRKDRIDVRELISTLYVLRKPSETAEDKLRELFCRYDLHDRGSVSLHDLRAIFLTCVGSDDDKYIMLKLYNEQFAYLEESGASTLSLDDYEELLGGQRAPVVQCFDNQMRVVQSFQQKQK